MQILHALNVAPLYLHQSNLRRPLRILEAREQRHITIIYDTLSVHKKNAIIIFLEVKQFEHWLRVLTCIIQNKCH